MARGIPGRNVDTGAFAMSAQCAHISQCVKRDCLLVPLLTMSTLQPTWSGPINEFIDAHCWQVHNAMPNAELAELHASYVRIAEPLLNRHLVGANITNAEFDRIVAHTKDNPELSDVIPAHVTALRDCAAFGKVCACRHAQSCDARSVACRMGRDFRKQRHLIVEQPISAGDGRAKYGVGP